MKRIGYSSLAALALVALASSAFALPSPNGVKFQLNNWQTCPGSPVITVNNYPALVSIEHDFLVCNAFAEQHVWRLSEDGGATVAQFPNASDFSVGADVTLTCEAGNVNGGETGLNIAPWWDGSMSDGRVNARVHDGEIACFGGRMPFFSFTGAYGILFTVGQPLHINITYHQGGLSALTPATATYDLIWQGLPYSSGPRNFDQGNLAEAPVHGLWGLLDYANVGGFLQARMDPGSISTNPAWMKSEWTNISFSGEAPVATAKTSWGALKSLYR